MSELVERLARGLCATRDQDEHWPGAEGGCRYCWELARALLPGRTA